MRSNLIPDAAKHSTRVLHGDRCDTLTHLRFAVWAMQQRDIDAITVRRVAAVMRCSRVTAQRLRDLWRDLVARPFYRDSVPEIVGALGELYGVKAGNDA
jgi:hypothetical protein